VPKLVRLEIDGQTREATKKERATWDGLRSCWADTLFSTMLRIIQSDQSFQRPELVALESLSMIRQRAGGSNRQFYTKLRTDTENAAAQSLRTCLGMGKYRRRATSTGYANADNISVIATSPQPIFSIAGLSMEQVGAYATEYLGRRDRDGGKYMTYGIHPKEVVDDIYTTVPSTGRIVLEAPIESFPIGDEDLFVADIPMQTPGPPIGCPMMFEPELAALFFQATAISAGEAQLI
jgi:hypothetical protein